VASKNTSLITAITIFLSATLLAQQPEKPSASEIHHNLQKLNFLGTMLYVAAHPDDENTWLISHFANDIKARAAYLSLTRGDGGQNEIGTEIREFLGIIRTQELLAARRMDGGRQFFTRANDFGYSKHPDETLTIWNKEEVKEDIVRAIRKWKPDIIINRFDHRTPGSTHGHHTSSAILSHEVFEAVGDASQYPEIAKKYGVWKPKRLFFNTYFSFFRNRKPLTEEEKVNIVEVETGSYFSDLGLSNGEIASLSRSNHKSQGFGSSGVRGNRMEHLEFLKGDFPKNKSDLFDGINTTWSRVEGGDAIGRILYQVEKDFDFRNPSASVPQLVKAYDLIKKLQDDHWRTVKLAEIEQIIMDCSGLFLEAVADQQTVAPKGELKVTVEAINRSAIPMKLHSMSSPVISFPSQFAASPLTENKKVTMISVEGTFKGSTYSTPYWLNREGTIGMYRVDNADDIGKPERDMLFPVSFNLTIAGIPISITKNIVYKFNDAQRGEVYRPFEVLPPVTASIPEKVQIFSSESSRDIPVVVRAGRDKLTGTVTLQHPKGWTVSPASQTFTMENKGSSTTLVFKVTPPKTQSEGFVTPLLQVGDAFYDKELFTIDYEHIPFQNVLMPSKAKVVRIPLERKGDNIGYIKGAGDLIPESLQQIGYNVTTISPDQISTAKLQQFDAVVVGVRAYNFVEELKFKKEDLNNYVSNGGTLILQYNKSRGLITDDFAPYTLKLSRDRVTDEFSKVTILNPKHPAFTTPNRITEKDFEGWVQERGLYFPNEWAPEFTPLLGMNDKGAPETKGSLLVAKHGKGHYVYTGLSFFRELPAGVPGAYRLFANLLSLGN